MHSVIIELPKPQVSNQLNKLSPVEIKRAKEYFQRLAHFQNLTVKRSKKDGFGYAQFGSNTIWVPTIQDKANFMTCLHEVGHTVQPLLVFCGQASCEYDAEMFALRRARHFGMDDAFLAEYEKHAKLYVAAYLEAGFKFNKVEWAELSPKDQEIATWLEVSQDVWDNASELTFINKLEINLELKEGVSFISKLVSGHKHLLAMSEYQRTTLEGFHSNLDLITHDLIRVDETSIK